MENIKNESEPITKLVGKHFSPMIIRRYSQPILTFVAVISDDNLDELDKVVSEYFGAFGVVGEVSIQEARNIAGGLCEKIKNKYNVEGVAVIMYFDKMVVSSLMGDFMNHLQCRLELYTLLNFMTNV